MVNKELLREASITGNKLTHLSHTEDLYLFGERAGAFAIKALKDVFSALQGNPSETDITLKVDGAPSVLAASNFNGDAFVATKGFFAKDRKIAFTEEDCKKYYGHAPDLERKMSKLLSYIHSIDIPQGEIWQGDFLFDSESLDKDTIEGEEHLIFHPNTIIYAVPMKDPLAKKISRSDVGVAWHTMYKGPDYDNLKISFGANVDNLGEVPGVFQIDSRIPNLANAMLGKEESLEIQIMIEDIVDLFNKVSQSGILTQIEEDNALQKYLLTYRNFLIKTKGIEEEETYLDGIIGWLAETFDKEIAKKKQPSTKEKYEKKKQEEIQKIENAREDLEEVVKLQNMTGRAKQALIDKLNGLGTFRTLVRHIDQGYLPAGEEGFAISDSTGNIQKFVSRLEFSKNNFSQEIVKGWMSNARMKESSQKIKGEDYEQAIVLGWYKLQNKKYPEPAQYGDLGLTEKVVNLLYKFPEALEAGTKIAAYIKNHFNFSGNEAAEVYGRNSSPLTSFWKQYGAKNTTPKTDLLIGGKRISLKIGLAQLMSGGKAESKATFYAALKNAPGLEKDENMNNILNMLDNFITSSRAPGKLAGLIKSKENEIINKANESHKEIMKELKNLFDSSEGFKIAFAREAMSGMEKFGRDSASAAEWMLASNPEGTQISIHSVFNDDYCAEIARKLKISVRFKTSSVKSKGTKTGEYNFWSVVSLIVNALSESTIREGSFFPNLWKRLKRRLSPSLKRFLLFFQLYPAIDIDNTINFL